MKNRKILLINNNASFMSAVAVVTKRNFDSLKAIYGEENVIVYNLAPDLNPEEKIWQKICRWSGTTLRFYIGGLTKKKIKDILRIIEHNGIDIAFLDTSLWGMLNKAIKKTFPQIEITTHFYDVELQYLFCMLKTTKRLFRFDLFLSFFINERFACKYSDKIVVLNSRDANLIKKYYGKNTSNIVPISLHDTFNMTIPESEIKTQHFTILFVGSYFYANIRGITWFVQEIMSSFLNIELEIVGNGMHKLKSTLERQNVSVYGTVPDLQEYYKRAHLVILPIFTGGGMKVKTAEALMYGKTIIGTPEAFCGYDYHPDIGRICANKTEFCEAIAYYLTYIPKQYNSASRELFLAKYSFDSTLEQFRRIFS